MPDEPRKKEFYRRIKIFGLLSFIPIVLVSAPLAGYFLGDFLRKRFNWSNYVTLAFTALGFILAAKEVIRIIRISMKIENE